MFGNRRHFRELLTRIERITREEKLVTAEDVLAPQIKMIASYEAV